MLIQRRQKEAAVIDVAIRSDRSIRKKENENLEEYQGLKEELEEMWGIKTTVVTGALGVCCVWNSSYSTYLRQKCIDTEYCIMQVWQNKINMRWGDWCKWSFCHSFFFFFFICASAASPVMGFSFWDSEGEQCRGLYEEEFCRDARVHETLQQADHTWRSRCS